MISRLLSNARQHPGAPFLLFEDQTWSFSDVAAIAQQGAGWLSSSGIAPGDRVVVAISNRPLFLFTWFSLLACGAVAVPVSHELFGESLRYIVTQSESRLLLCEESECARLTTELQTCGIVVEAFIDESDYVQRTRIAKTINMSQLVDHTPAAILYTSGTTGQPKGVIIPNRSYLAAGEKVTRAVGMTAADRILTFLPLHHANPQMYSVMSALTVGCSVAIVARFSASKFLQQAEQMGATGFTYVGTVLSILAKEWTAPVRSGLRWCVGGGAPRAVWQHLAEMLPARIHELYGMTETGGLVTVNSRERYRFGSVGAARDDFDVTVLDSTGEILPAGQIGEIAVRPRMPFIMTTGYYRKPEETLAALENLWFHTGDLGRFDEEGFLFFEGRKKELIRRGGEMMSPVEIELAALKFPCVADCAAVGVPDDILEEEVKLVVVCKEGFEMAELIAFLRASLPRHMVPRYLEFVTIIPKTPTQKVQRFKLARNSAQTIDLKTVASPS